MHSQNTYENSNILLTIILLLLTGTPYSQSLVWNTATQQAEANLLVTQDNKHFKCF